MIGHYKMQGVLPEGMDDGDLSPDRRAARLGVALRSRKDRPFSVVGEDGKRFVLVIRKKRPQGRSRRSMKWAVLRKAWR